MEENLETEERNLVLVELENDDERKTRIELVVEVQLLLVAAKSLNKISFLF